MFSPDEVLLETFLYHSCVLFRAFGVDVFMKRGFGKFDTLFPSQEKYFVPEIEYVFGFVAFAVFFGFFFRSLVLLG